jgi:hypothetical protein
MLWFGTIILAWYFLRSVSIIRLLLLYPIMTIILASLANYAALSVIPTWIRSGNSMWPKKVALLLISGSLGFMALPLLDISNAAWVRKTIFADVISAAIVGSRIATAIRSYFDR